MGVLSEIYHSLVVLGFTCLDSFKEFVDYKYLSFEKDGRNFRFFVETLVIEKGDSDFDRWANSVDDKVYLNKLNLKHFNKKIQKLMG